MLISVLTEGLASQTLLDNGEVEMQRIDLLLSIIAAAKGAKVTPVQLQKIAFLVGEKFGEERLGSYYRFRKYDYGPFSADVYADAEQLEREGLVVISMHPRGGWREYSATHQGLECAFNDLQEDIAEYIREKVSWAKELSFQQLVRAVYKEFPDFRENSVFQG